MHELYIGKIVLGFSAVCVVAVVCLKMPQAQRDREHEVALVRQQCEAEITATTSHFESTLVGLRESVAHLSAHSHHTLHHAITRVCGITASLRSQFAMAAEVAGGDGGVGEAEGSGGEGEGSGGDDQVRGVVAALDALARAVGAAIGSVQAQAEGDWAVEVSVLPCSGVEL
jgi:hypothetical protein